MKPASGRADSAEPSTIIDSGSVAMQGFGLSICPVNPPTMKIIDICAPITACASSRTMTLRRARRIGSVIASVIPGSFQSRRLARAGLDRGPVAAGDIRIGAIQLPPAQITFGSAR